MAYLGPVRFEYVGDRVEATRWTRTARLFIAQLQQEMGSKGVISARRRRKASDRVWIEIDIAGAQITARITAALPGARQADIDEQFVVWARNPDFPDGLDDTYPQQMLQYKDGNWVTRFFSPEVYGRVTIDGRIGTYRTEQGIVFFPDGVRHAGNIDWKGPDGARVSWYGPSSRYWYDAYVQPRAQYGKKVFMLGHVLLDTEAYIAASDSDSFDTLWVMGAALTADGGLLVVHAYLTEDQPDPEEDAPPRTVFISAPYPNVGGNGPLQVGFTVSRFAVARDSDVPTRFNVVPNSRTVIGSFNLVCAFNPWFFNESATTAVTCTLPALPGIATNGANIISAPSESSQVWRLDLESLLLTPDVYSLPPGASSAPCAADYKGDQLVYMRMERVPQIENTGPTEGYRVSAGAWSATLLRETMVGGNVNQQEVEWRYLKFADLREDFYVTTRLGVSVTLGVSPQVIVPLFAWGTEYWYAGRTSFVQNDMTEITQGSALTNNIANNNREARRAFAKATFSPMQPLYMTAAGMFNGGITAYTWFRGASNSYERLSYRPDQLFGVWTITGAAPLPWNRVRDRTGDPDAPVDFDGQVNVAAGAAFNGVAMYSGTARTSDNAIHRATHAVLGGDGRQLPSLTGVGGPESRYHPLWLLGTIPR